MTNVMLIHQEFQSSFLDQALLLVKGLHSLGVEVHAFSRSLPQSVIERMYTRYQPDTVILYATFGSMSSLFRKSNVVLFDVSDTDMMAPQRVEQINKSGVSVVVTPSKWSASGYHDITVPMVVIPHAYHEDIKKAKPKTLATSSSHHVFFLSAPHSPERKGFDLSVYALSHTENTFAIARVQPDSCFKLRRSGVPSYCIFSSLPYPDYFSWMSTAQFFLHPSRGGAFEIPVLEALTLGLSVAIPEKSAPSEIPLHDEDVVKIPVSSRVKLWDSPVHVGSFLDMNPDDVANAVHTLITDRPTPDPREYLSFYSPTEIARQWLEKVIM